MRPALIFKIWRLLRPKRWRAAALKEWRWYQVVFQVFECRWWPWLLSLIRAFPTIRGRLLSVLLFLQHKAVGEGLRLGKTVPSSHGAPAWRTTPQGSVWGGGACLRAMGAAPAAERTSRYWRRNVLIKNIHHRVALPLFLSAVNMRPQWPHLVPCWTAIRWVGFLPRKRRERKPGNICSGDSSPVFVFFCIFQKPELGGWELQQELRECLLCGVCPSQRERKYSASSEFRGNPLCSLLFSPRLTDGSTGDLGVRGTQVLHRGTPHCPEIFYLWEQISFSSPQNYLIGICERVHSLFSCLYVSFK